MEAGESVKRCKHYYLRKKTNIIFGGNRDLSKDKQMQYFSNVRIAEKQKQKQKILRNNNLL